MSTSFIIYGVFYLCATIALIIGFANEDKMIAFENKLFRAIGRKTKNKKKKNSSVKNTRGSAPSAKHCMTLTPPSEHIDFEFFNAA